MRHGWCSVNRECASRRPSAPYSFNIINIINMNVFIGVIVVFIIIIMITIKIAIAIAIAIVITLTNQMLAVTTITVDNATQRPVKSLKRTRTRW